MFFLAPDDESAARTRSSHPGRTSFAGVECDHFDPDDAVVDWTVFFENPERALIGVERRTLGKWPRYVADFRNDGVGVFVMPAELVTALAAAEPDELRRLASYWRQRLVEQDSHELTTEAQLAVVDGVARLARSATGFGLYCWQN